MEELIQWLVILFFIISFLNSILKPKKTQQKTPADTGDRVLTSGPTVEIPEIQDDLEEIIRKRRREAERKKQELNKELQRKYSEFKSFESSQPEIKIKRQPIKQAEMISQQLLTEKTVSVEPLPDYLRNLLNPASARKAILVSEILGKPKALKRKW